MRFPPLILVTAGDESGLVVLEGHARLTAFMLCAEALPPSWRCWSATRRR